MQPSKRDPRVDPKPGDVLHKMTDPVMLLITERQVLPVPGGLSHEWVYYRVNDGRATRSTSLNKWRKWAKSAEVIHAAE